MQALEQRYIRGIYMRDWQQYRNLKSTEHIMMVRQEGEGKNMHACTEIYISKNWSWLNQMHGTTYKGVCAEQNHVCQLHNSHCHSGQLYNVVPVSVLPFVSLSSPSSIQHHISCMVVLAVSKRTDFQD